MPIKCWVFSGLSLLCKNVSIAQRLVWGTTSQQEWMKEERKKVVFEVQQEENLLYGLIGMRMAGLSEEWLGERDWSIPSPVTLELLRHGSGVTGWKWLCRFCCSNSVKCHRSTQVTNWVFRIKAGNKRSPLNLRIARIKWDWLSRLQMTWSPFRQYRIGWLCNSKQWLVSWHSSDIYKHINLGFSNFLQYYPLVHLCPSPHKNPSLWGGEIVFWNANVVF